MNLSNSYNAEHEIKLIKNYNMKQMKLTIKCNQMYMKCHWLLLGGNRNHSYYQFSSIKS